MAEAVKIEVKHCKRCGTSVTHHSGECLWCRQVYLTDALLRARTKTSVELWAASVPCERRPGECDGDFRQRAIVELREWTREQNQHGFMLSKAPAPVVHDECTRAFQYGFKAREQFPDAFAAVDAAEQRVSRPFRFLQQPPSFPACRYWPVVLEAESAITACTECNGSGEYVGFTTREPCQACHGVGRGFDK